MQTFPGWYGDGVGAETITWRFVRIRSGDVPTFEIQTRIRGVEIRGGDFDMLEPAPGPPGRLPLTAAGELGDCVLAGDLPCMVVRDGRQVASAIRFRLDLRHPAPRRPLSLSVEVEGVRYAVQNEWFEDGVLSLQAELPAGVAFRCCVTCLYSDYWPAGHGLTGMRCHRDAKQRYLAVRRKLDYWSVPVTEEVPETYLCAEYQRRVPGTGYRG